LHARVTGPYVVHLGAFITGVWDVAVARSQTGQDNPPMGSCLHLLLTAYAPLLSMAAMSAVLRLQTPLLILLLFFEI
jgi:hypothetical protein